MKVLLGLFFILVDLLVVLFGAGLTCMGVIQLGSDSGEGKIKVILKVIGEISGVNGRLVVILAGVAMILLALGYALKAFQGVVAIRQVSGIQPIVVRKRGIRDIIRHFAPLRQDRLGESIEM